MEETVTSSVESSVEKELKSFSWGAFVLGWIWGIRNRVWISFLTLIPILGIIMAFVLGYKGRRWSWNTGRWRDFESFKKSQENWDVAGVIIFSLNIILFIVSLFLR